MNSDKEPRDARRDALAAAQRDKVHAGGAVAHIVAAGPILRGVLWLVAFIALLLVAGGIVLIWLGATGDTEMTVFGQKLKSGNVGVVGIVSGLILALMAIKAVLSTTAKLGEIDGRRDRAVLSKPKLTVSASVADRDIPILEVVEYLISESLEKEAPSTSNDPDSRNWETSSQRAAVKKIQAKLNEGSVKLKGIRSQIPRYQNQEIYEPAERPIPIGYWEIAELDSAAIVNNHPPLTIPIAAYDPNVPVYRSLTMSESDMRTIWPAGPRNAEKTINLPDKEIDQIRRCVLWLSENLSSYDPYVEMESKVMERYSSLKDSDHPIWAKSALRQFAA